MTLNVKSKHPQYVRREEDWALLSDSFEGERRIKAAGTKYLPATSSMQEDGMGSTDSPGWKAYEAYRKCFRS